MKIKPSIVTVTLASPDGDARLVFSRPKTKERLKFSADLELAKDKPMHEREQFTLDAILSRLISVEGLTYDDGTPITAEQVKGLELDDVTYNQIVVGYVAALSQDGASPEKNADASAS